MRKEWRIRIPAHFSMLVKMSGRVRTECLVGFERRQK